MAGFARPAAGAAGGVGSPPPRCSSIPIAASMSPHEAARRRFETDWNAMRCSRAMSWSPLPSSRPATASHWGTVQRLMKASIRPSTPAATASNDRSPVLQPVSRVPPPRRTWSSAARAR